jgi:hypothetical protein
MRDILQEHGRELLALQRGVITRAQATAAGLTEKAIAVRVGTGRWQRLHAGVYATFSGEPARPALFWAAVLRSGPGSALSHETAAELYGLLDSPSPSIHVTVPSGSQIARPRGVMVHYSVRLEQSRHPALTPPRTRIEDTVLDLAETLPSLDDAVALVLRAAASRRTTVERISAAMARRRRMRWRRGLTAALALGREGVHSLLEFRYVNRVERPHGLPAGRRQRLVQRDRSRQYQDVQYEGYGLVVELDGRDTHPDWSRRADVRRDNANVAAGEVTLRYAWADVTERPCRTAREVADALRRRGWEGAVRRCGAACLIQGSPSGHGRLGA